MSRIQAAQLCVDAIRFRPDTAVGAVRQPHDLTLENLAERGVIGTLMLLVVLVAVGIKAVKLRRSDASVQTRALAAGLCAGIGYWLVHAQAEWFWQLPAVTLPAFMYMGFVLGAPWRLHSSRTLKGFVRWPLVGLCALALVSTGATYVAGSYVLQSERYATTDPARAVTILRRAARLDPVSADVQQQLANRAEANDDPATAQRAVAAQIMNDPDSYTSYLFAAQYYDRNGDPRAAQQLLAKARALNPRDPALDGQAELVGAGGK